MLSQLHGFFQAPCRTEVRGQSIVSGGNVTWKVKKEME